VAPNNRIDLTPWLRQAAGHPGVRWTLRAEDIEEGNFISRISAVDASMITYIADFLSL